MTHIIKALMILVTVVFVVNTASAVADMRYIGLQNETTENKTAHVEFKDNVTGKIRIPEITVKWGGLFNRYFLKWDASKETIVKLSWVDNGNRSCKDKRNEIYKGASTSSASYYVVIKGLGHNNYRCEQQ